MIKINERSYQFSLAIIKMIQDLPKNQTKKIISAQLLRSSTSIGANVEEAQGAHTKSDFSYCINVAKKEARESLYWLKLLRETNKLLTIKLNPLLTENEELIKILTSIVKTSKTNNQLITNNLSLIEGR